MYEAELITTKIQDILEQNGIFLGMYSEHDSLDMDSLTIISVLVSLENEFDIEFDDSLLVELPQTFKQLADVVQNQTALIYKAN